MRNYAKLVAAGALSLAMISGSAFAATPTATPAQSHKAVKAPVKKATMHAAKKTDKKAK